MAIQEFSKLIQEKVYKDWLAKLDANIVSSTTKALRVGEQTSEKTSFYITEKTLKELFNTITGKTLDNTEAQVILEEIRKPITGASDKSGAIVGKYINVEGGKALFFESIAFDTITTRLNSVLDNIPDIQEGYREAEDNFENEQLKVLRSSAEYKKLPIAKKKEAEKKITLEAKRRATLGFYYNKGHVVAVATNLARQFRKEVEKADILAEKQRAQLLSVLDQYINKLLKDDLDTANLPNAVSQELYARYIKSSDKYLVELQVASGNIEAGRSSIAIVEELRNIFSGTLAENTLISTIKNSPALGNALIEGEGSPSMVSLIKQQIVDTLQTGKPVKKVYTSPKVLIGSNKVKIKKPKSNASKISTLKKLKSKVSNTKRNTQKIKEIVSVQESPVNLVNLLNASLHDQIRKNMGTGDRRDVLNYRTGRFATSVKVEQVSTSRMGMITAFYTYMKNPYATFSRGGRQEFPRTRDPKTLISRSIREIASNLVTNQLRAVNV